MEDSWVYIDDDDSSNCSLTDSDKIDSETEAELYSRLHHEPNLSFINSEDLNEHSSGLLLYSASKDIFCMNKHKNESKLDTNLHHNSINTDNVSNVKRKSSEMDADCNEKLTPDKKPKIESLCQSVNLDSSDYKNINDLSKFTISNIQNKNTVCISNIKKETVKQESSDSDNDIWIEECPAEKSDLKINLLKDTDTIFLSSSDSDNESDISSPFKKRDSILRNLSMPNIKTEENPKGLWHINSEDQRGSKKQFHRYHDNFDITCSNCNRKGHTFRTCPSPRVIKCFICGGNHMGFRCPKRVCSNCHTIGHDRKYCQIETFKEFCHVCNMEGHAKGNCPDIWRRYHLTTTPFELKRGKQVKQSTNLYCWNCGKCGHFGAICHLSHLSRRSFSTLPCVISYAYPKLLLKNRLSILKKHSYLSMQNLNRSISNISNASSSYTDHLRPENTLNVSGGSIEENRGNKSGGRQFKTASRFDKIQDIVNGKDFPRTLKKRRNKFKSKEPRSFYLLVREPLNKLRKRFNQEVKEYGIQACESLTQNDVSRELNNEFDEDFNNLPEAVKIGVKQRFQRWQKKKIRRMKLKERKKRELAEG